MIKIKAYIELYSEGRKTSFTSGYRPLFEFEDSIKTSGKINLIDRLEFFPCESGEVEIYFLNKEYLGDHFGIGAKFTFGEGGISLGEGLVSEIISIVE